MSATSKKMTVAAGAGVALIAAGAAGSLAIAAAQTVDVQAGGEACVQEASATQVESANRVTVNKVEGAFAFTQAEVAGNDYLAQNFAEGSKYLCGAKGATDEQAQAQNWMLTVEGAVEKGYSATIDELAESPAVQNVVMGCSCLGNPVDGRAAANALVNGVSALVLVQMANPSADANTVVFTSDDGYQVALPLAYLESHYCPIVFDVNGSPIADSMGGTNQLWLGSTPASYFIRNVSSITLEARDAADVPVSPSSDEARTEYAANLPNVGVLLGGQVA